MKLPYKKTSKNWRKRKSKNRIIATAKVVLIGVILALLSFASGYAIGTASTASFMLDKAQLFLKAEGINLTINSDLIKTDLFRYANNIGACP